MINLIDANFESLDELEYILCNIQQDTYEQISPLTGYNVGRHLRHVLGFYIALQTSENKEIADYNVRQRDDVTETDLQKAKDKIVEIKSWLSTITVDKQLSVITEIQQKQTLNITVESSLSRELAFVSIHTTHHVAYIELMLKSMDIVLDKCVGLAPSTSTFLRKQAQA